LFWGHFLDLLMQGANYFDDGFIAEIATFNVFGIAYTNQIFDRIMVYKRLSTMTPFESVRYSDLFADCSDSSFSMPYNSMSS
jgi:hypothetical protein